METTPTDMIILDAPTETTEVVLVDAVDQLRNDLIHVNLFGSFLICGALIGVALCWRWHR